MQSSTSSCFKDGESNFGTKWAYIIFMPRSSVKLSMLDSENVQWNGSGEIPRHFKFSGMQVVSEKAVKFHWPFHWVKKQFFSTLRCSENVPVVGGKVGWNNYRFCNFSPQILTCALFKVLLQILSLRIINIILRKLPSAN